jgi:hypothetical protein
MDALTLTWGLQLRFFIVFSEKIRGCPHPFLFIEVLVKNQQTVLVQEQF